MKNIIVRTTKDQYAITMLELADVVTVFSVRLDTSVG